MKTITTRKDFLDMFDGYGVPIEPFQLSQGCRFYGLQDVTSLQGIQFTEDCWLYGLNNVISLQGTVLSEDCRLQGLTGVTSLDGIQLAQNCQLYHLAGVTSLDGIQLAEGCTLHNLENVTVKPLNPSEAELDIMKRIPVERLKMSNWHCGTSHCLAGFAQVLDGREAEDASAFRDGCEILPSMQGFFFASQNNMTKFLRTLHHQL